MVHYTDRTIHLTDIVFPKNINHHETLFGGAALSYMDKVAFIAATRFGRCHFVTASCDNIDFEKPAFKGNIVDFAATVVEAGRRALKVEVVMMAEDMLTGEQVICTRGTFNMVAVPAKGEEKIGNLPLSGLKMAEKSYADPNADQRLVELVFVDDTNHHGTLFGGHGLSLMAKAGFITATRHCRSVMVLASLDKTNFKAPIQIGEIVDLSAKVIRVGNKSLTVNVKMWGEGLLTGERNFCADSDFIMVAVDENGNSKKICQ
jgi:acyl-CoA hydrolase